MIGIYAQEMKFIEEITMTTYGIPEVVLMENAATAVTKEIVKYLNETNNGHAISQVLVIAGIGNNGADGLCVARQLNHLNIKSSVVLVGDVGKGTEAIKRYEAVNKKLGIQIHYLNQSLEVESMLASLPQTTILVDALFGIGLGRPIEGVYKQMIEWMNEQECPIFAVDLPSGIDPNSGKVLGSSVKAYTTVTFTLPKIGQLILEGVTHCGKLIVADIGIPEKVIEEVLISKPEGFIDILEDDVLSNLPKRPSDGHKGSFGCVGIFGGSSGMFGAPILSSKAAYKTGCGLVHLLTEEQGTWLAHGHLLEVLTTSIDSCKTKLACDPQETEELEGWLEKILARVDALVVGPGWGQGVFQETVLFMILEKATCPVVLDADALNILAKNLEWLGEKSCPVVITPHYGEMVRLTGYPMADIKMHPLAFAQSFSERYGVTVVLKSERTTIYDSQSKGLKSALNIAGNPGMATAGSGDVLAGVIGSLLAQGLSPQQAAKLGVYIHSKAGDFAAEKVGMASLMATDLIEAIYLVLKEGNSYESSARLCRN